MRKICWILFLLLLSARVYATRSDFSFDTTAAIRGYCSFSKVNVVDIRADQRDFGTNFDGAGVDYFNTGIPFKDALRDYGEHLIKNAQTDTNVLLILLRDVSVNVNPSGIGVGTIYVNIECYIGSVDKYRLANVFHEMKEINPGPQLVDRTLSEFNVRIFSCIAKVARLKIGELDTAVYSEATSRERLSNLKKQYAIYQVSDYKEGVYYTVDDFLNHVPRDSNITMTREKGRIVSYLVNDNNEHVRKLDEGEFFAIYYQRKWFKSGPKGCTYLLKKDNDFYCKMNFEGFVRRETPAGIMTLGGIAGGVVGAFFGYAAYTAIPNMTEKDKKNFKALYESRVDCEGKRIMPIARIN